MHKIEKLAHNLTCCATISRQKVEFLRFFYEGGTTNEVFMDYFDNLVITCKERYPQQKLLFILDNLAVNHIMIFNF